MRTIDFEPLYTHAVRADRLEHFLPATVDMDYLRRLGVTATPSEQTLEGLRRGSEILTERLRAGTLIPKNTFLLAEADINQIRPEIHNYTGRCPTLTYEINPVRGCALGCQYCLVTDGSHEQPLTALDNYQLYVRQLLETYNGASSDNAEHFYYFSPKTEALQEPTLYTGIAHRILREFISHYRRNPASHARLFVASKAGAAHLLYKYEGERIIDLFVQLKGKMQFNTSVSVMPTPLRDLLEPFAAPVEERLKAVALCQQHGIAANSALVQPILTPCLTDEAIATFFGQLHQAGIINYKPEFLTVSMENIAILGQYLAYSDPSAARRLFDDYLSPANAGHRKQRQRTAPDKEVCRHHLKRMIRHTDTLGMSVSICYWVRQQLGIDERMIPVINRNGFQCLGYQTTLFHHV